MDTEPLSMVVVSHVQICTEAVSCFTAGPIALSINRVVEAADRKVALVLVIWGIPLSFFRKAIVIYIPTSCVAFLHVVVTLTGFWHFLIAFLMGVRQHHTVVIFLWIYLFLFTLFFVLMKLLWLNIYSNYLHGFLWKMLLIYSGSWDFKIESIIYSMTVLYNLYMGLGLFTHFQSPFSSSQFHGTLLSKTPSFLVHISYSFVRPSKFN